MVFAICQGPIKAQRNVNHLMLIAKSKEQILLFLGEDRNYCYIVVLSNTRWRVFLMHKTLTLLWLCTQNVLHVQVLKYEGYKFKICCFLNMLFLIDTKFAFHIIFSLNVSIFDMLQYQSQLFFSLLSSSLIFKNTEI